MQILFEHKPVSTPAVSIILLDWSCRESFHILRYLENQTVSRDQYEVLWIEYYERHAPAIAEMLKVGKVSGRHSVLDQWIVMNIPREICYHKHLMFNVGIVRSHGKILVFANSDAIVRPTFVENIMNAFRDHPNIVLHIDEVRNVNRSFYPFNYPDIPSILGAGCINWDGRQTRGIQNAEDPLHERNYGACMAALREDIVKAGGADEHKDYLGHICGPYEMTFRLANMGKLEIWHSGEFLYHVWHPGTDGKGNYMGPHDGRNFSTTALKIKVNARTLPLVENPAIRALRTQPNVSVSHRLTDLVISRSKMKNWAYKDLPCVFGKPACQPDYEIRHFATRLKLQWAIFNLLARQVFNKTKSGLGSLAAPKSFFNKIRSGFLFLWRMWGNSIYTVNMCHEVLRTLAAREEKSFSIYGANTTAKILCLLAGELSLKVMDIFDSCSAGARFFSFKVKSPDRLKEQDGKVILAFFTNISERCEELKQLGVHKSRIVRIQ